MLLGVLVILIVVGVILWVINSYVPMDDKVKHLLNIVVILFLVFWLLRVFGVIHYLKVLSP